MKVQALLILSIILASNLPGAEVETFTSEPFSISVSAPRTWKLVPADFPTEEYDLRSKNVAAVVAKHTKVPIVRIAKPVPGNVTISPAIQIFVVEDKGALATEYLNEAIKSAAANFDDFKITKEASVTSLAGIRGASIESAFTATYPGGRHFSTLSRTWALPHRKMMFVISLTGQPSDLKSLEADVDLILKSIHFKDR